MQQFNSKEKYLLANTLNCIPLLLQGRAVLIDLRNETSVAGRIDNADGHMNVHLRDAVFIDRNGLQYPFEQFMVRERMIRQLHVPADVDMEAELQQWTQHGLRRKRQPLRGAGLARGKRSYKQKRAETRHAEILQEIAREKQKKAGAAATRGRWN